MNSLAMFYKDVTGMAAYFILIGKNNGVSCFAK